MADISSQDGLGSFRTRDFPDIDDTSPITNLVAEAQRRGWMPPALPVDPSLQPRDALTRIADALEAIAGTLTRMEHGTFRGGAL